MLRRSISSWEEPTFSESLENQVVGNIVLGFDNGETFTEELVAGQNIRENWGYVSPPANPTDDQVITSINPSANWQNVYREDQTRAGKAALGYVDLLTIQVPEEDRNSTLTTITINDTSYDPSILIYAVTVSTTGSALPNVTPVISQTPQKGNQLSDPLGKIVFTCQVFKDENRNQVCIMNADGTNQHRLTHDNKVNSWYPSLAPDGESVVYSSNQSGAHEIYEMDMNGNATQLTTIGEAYAPEISPDGKYIVFTNSHGVFSSIWIMKRDGGNPHLLYRSTEHDVVAPNWSPDGSKNPVCSW